MQKNNMSFLKQNLIAHRGLHDISKKIPENSIKAFEEAIKNNYIIELDIHVLKDNLVVVFHDNNLKRMTSVNKDIKDTSYNEIKDLKLQNTDNYIPLLKDVLKLVDGKVPLLIEFKYDTKNKRLEKEAMKILKNYKGKYAIQSFNPFTVYWFKKNYPNILRGQLAANLKNDNMNFIKKFVLKNMLFNIFTKPDFVSYNINSLPSKQVKTFRKNKLVLSWTIKNKKDLEKAKLYSDNFICENMNTLIED